MDDPAAFLQARLDEDEADARARRGIFPSPAVLDNGGVALHVQRGGNAVIAHYRHPVEGYSDMAALRAWADTESGWTDVRVLRLVQAERVILAEYERLRESLARYPNAVNGASFAALQGVVRTLAEAAQP